MIGEGTRETLDLGHQAAKRVAGKREADPILPLQGGIAETDSQFALFVAGKPAGDKRAFGRRFWANYTPVRRVAPQ